MFDEAQRRILSGGVSRASTDVCRAVRLPAPLLGQPSTDSSTLTASRERAASAVDAHSEMSAHSKSTGPSAMPVRGAI